MTKPAKVPAAEVRRLARIRELAGHARRSERALERAIRAAHARGISVRKIAAAAGVAPMNVWRLVRTADGQPYRIAKDTTSSTRVAKPKEAGK